MKNTAKFLALFISTLSVFAHASDGAEALQRFHERSRATVTRQTEREKPDQKESQVTEQDKQAEARADQGRKDAANADHHR